MNFKKYKTCTVYELIQDEDFIRWVNNPSTEDKMFWESFLQSNSDKSQEIEEAKTFVLAMTEAPPQTKLSNREKEEMLSEMQLQIQKSGSNKEIQLSSPYRKLRFWATAAAAIILIGCLTWTWSYLKQDAHMITHQTSYGEQQVIELPDGSLIKLNANSSLNFEDSWNDQDSRKVWLNGEAFFEVEKKVETSQKFQVITKDLTVEVLGTIFNVNSHQEKTKVFLEEGKVKLNLNGLEQAMLMEPGELVAYAKSQKERPKKRKVLPTVHTSWKDGLQLFDNTPLKEVLEKLEEIYGVKIQAKDTSSYSRKINTGLPVENLEEALSILELTMGLNIIKEQENFVIQ